jgi:voltage-gated potassium channel
MIHRQFFQRLLRENAYKNVYWMIRMKMQAERFRFFPQKPVHLLQRITSRRNATLLLRLFTAFIILMILYVAAFRYLMQLEGREYSVITGVYWILSTMTTLGLGDIAFASEAGRLFTVLVVCTGVFFLLVLVPFTIIRLFQSSARIPRELPAGTRGHVILTEYGPLTSALIERLQRYNQNYALLVPDLDEASQLRDQGIKTVAGELDDPGTFREIRVERAALLVATGSDVTNTTLAYTVRRVSKDIPLIATASGKSAMQILLDAGCTHVLALDEMMGQSLGRRIIAGDAMAHVIGQIDDLVVAEAAACGTPLVGKTVDQVHAGKLFDASIVGIWEGGDFSLPKAGRIITDKSVLVIAGLQNHIDRYNELFCIYHISSAPILIIGGGSVGRALSSAMQERDLDFRIVEKSKELILDDPQYIHGDITDPQILQRSGFFQAPAVAVTTHHDPTNIYLTTYLRHLRKDIQIISRATLDRSVHTLHTAGCDFVISHASLGANNIFSLSKRGNILMIAEGVDVFRVKTPAALAGKTINYAGVREECGCEVIGVGADGAMMINPYRDTALPAEGEMILIGSVESEEKFFRRYKPKS